MGYWDFAPPSWHHAKKPLTRAQIKKLQQAYAKAGIISETVKDLETQEQQKTEKEIDEIMKTLM